MEDSNLNKKSKSDTFFKVLVIILLIIISYTSIRNMFYLEDINSKLNLLPTMDFSGIKDNLQRIGDSLKINIFDIIK